jgi:hypothetical protein
MKHLVFTWLHILRFVHHVLLHTVSSFLWELWMELLVLIWLHIRRIVHSPHVITAHCQFFFFWGNWTKHYLFELLLDPLSSQKQILFWRVRIWKVQKKWKKRSEICFQFCLMDFTFLVSFQTLTKIRYQNQILFWNQILLKGTLIKYSWKLCSSWRRREGGRSFVVSTRPSNQQVVKRQSRLKEAQIRDPTSSPWDILGSPSTFHSHKSTCKKNSSVSRAQVT